MAKVIKPFHGAKDGAIYPQDFNEGDIVEGDLARVALEQGWAEDEKDPGSDGTDTGSDGAEKKARKNAPENK